MAFRFPGADSPAAFWRDISAGVSRVHRFTRAELAAAGVPERDYRSPDFTGASGLITGIDRFDAEFFGMTAREAAITDPQQRLFLECCHHALEDGGYAGADARVGVYASTGYRLYSLHSYLDHNLAAAGWEPDWMSVKQVQVGNYADFTATRAAFRLGLTGPAINVATACSGALVAVHLAAQAVRLGDADLAIAGGSALHLPQVTGHRHVKGSTISRTGVIRPFDAAADGTVGGNGVAAVLLKRLDRALADGDTVHAVILGSGVTNDGADKAGFPAPSVSGQRDAVLRALETAAVPATSIGYLEAHGTGTRKGDPIEFEALRSAFARHTDRTGFCSLGTVKPAIGHLDSCAGLAGLIKAVLVLRHGVLPPLVNFREPNPAIDLAASPFTIDTDARAWPDGDHPRRAGVHSVGMGGTNAHVILEAPPAAPARHRRPVPGVLPLSARDPQALADLAAAYRDHLRRHPDTSPTDLLTTAALGRRHFTHRLVALGRTPAELADALDRPNAGPDSASPDRGIGSGPDGELARSYCLGADIDWAAELAGSGGGRISLPHYPFRPTRHWVGPPLGGERPDQQHKGGSVAAETVTRVIELTARHLGYEPGEIDPDRSFVDLGADSLQLVGIMVALEGEYGVEIDMAELLDAAPNPNMVAELIGTRRTATEPPRPEPVEPEPIQARHDEPVPVEPMEPVEPPAPLVDGPRVSVPVDSGMVAAAGDRQRAHADELVRRLTERTKGSKEQAARYRGVLADSRAVVGFRSATKEMLYPIVSRAARGSRLEDVDGNSYVDITMGFGALLFGHEPEFVTEAVREHLAHGLRLGPRSADTGEAAQLLAELTGAERVAFANSGTEANSAAIRLARAATGRTRIVTFRGAYHGHIDSLLGRPGGQLRTVPASAGIPDSAVAEVIVLEYGSAESLDVIAAQAGQIAAVLVEPVQCRNPALRPVEFVRALRELTRRHGIVLIFDEMLTGLRPHQRGAQHHYGVTADLATYGKALGSGFPIGAIAGRADILDGVDGGFWRYGDDSRPTRDTVFYGGTYIQHPVSMAAARAVLTHLRDQGPEVQESVNARTARLGERLNTFFADEAFPLRMDWFGSMFRFTHRADLELLYHHLLLRGVYVWEWRSCYLSTAHTDADIDHIVDAVQDSLGELRRAGYFPDPRPASRPAPVVRPRPAPDFSVYFFGDSAEGDQQRHYDLIFDTARFADEHDFHAVWLPERHFHSFGGLFPNPSVLAAALARHTSRVRLNAGSVVLPLHDPIRVAEEWSVVDNLSAGRVGLGFGTGWHAEDFALHPERFDRRRDIAFDGLDEVRRLWRGEAVSRRSGDGQPVDVRVYPRPVQDQPPMFLATSGRPESYAQAGRLDLGVVTNLMSQTVEQLAENIGVYRRARADAGLDPDAGRVTVLLHTYVTDDHATARADAAEPMIRYLRSSLLMRSAASAAGPGPAELAAASEEDLERLFRRAYDRYCDRRALIGTPESCAATVDALRDAGVTEIAALVDFGLPAEKVSTGLIALDRLRRRFHDAAPARTEAPATPAQRRIWLACQLIRPNAYNEIQAVRLHGRLDESVLRTALRGLVERHPGLRTVFRPADDTLHQVVLDQLEVPLTVELGTGDPDADIAAAIRAESHRHRDLAEGPLFTPRLLRLAADDHVLILNSHHIITDGHSAGVLAADLTEHYRAAAEARPPRWAGPPGSTLDLPAAMPEPADLDWWRAHLGAEPPVLDLPTDRPRTRTVAGRGGSVGTVLSAERTETLRRWSGEQGVTLLATLHTAWRIVLRRFSGQDEFLLGATFNARPTAARNTIGFFAALLPLRARLTDDLSLRSAVRATRDLVLQASRRSHVDLDTLLSSVNPDPGAARPLIPVSVDLDDEPLAGIDLPGLRAEPVTAGTESAPLELSLMAVRTDSGLRLRLRYDSDLYAESTARGYLAQLELVLAGMADATSTTRIGELRTGVVDEDPASDDAVLDLALPEVLRTTVVAADARVPGAQLSSAAAAIADRLAALRVGPGDVVALALPRGADFLAAMLGTLATGAAYLPLDIGQPWPRCAAMLADAAPAAIVCAPDFQPDLGLPRVHPGGRADTRLAINAKPVDLLCLLYTSGSTGRPKGVAVEHGNVAAVLKVYRDRLGITAQDRLSWYSSTGFDASLVEVWPALQTGAELHVVPEDTRLDPAELVAWFVRTRITVAFLPTVIAEAVLREPWPADAALRVLCTGGERLTTRPRPDVPFTVYNIYGPTECCVFCSWGPVTPDGSGMPSIGTANPGMRLEIRDASGRVLPPGAVGELHVSGPQVARGYHADPVLTAARFSTDAEDRRWYRTGDLARLRPDGELDFAGRVDDQVKIRGFRVEPAEVTAAVRKLPGIPDARVVAADGELICYIRSDEPLAEQSARWRAQLAEVLPRPMVPLHWRVVREFPLNGNGKWDHHAPADLDTRSAVRAEWAAVLGNREFADDTRFFDLGGHSVNAITLLNRIRTRFDTDYPLGEFFDAPTVAGMVARLSGRVRGEL
ncbi:acyl carrier protein [Kutzneria buriramensis]|uniref:Acyl carrier protein n=2 Tax=Kutzneria buriramensis TaxID=1045776 RepID=A0A3E0HKA4_9PSEU|nr:acyl carrier protein [Kutzneria buriramensis]